MELNFIPLDYDYFDYKGKNYIKLIGRTDKGKRVCVIDSFEPYFYAILDNKTSNKKLKELKNKIEKIKIKSASRLTKIEKIELQEKNFLSKPVKALKIYLTNFKDAHPVADKLGFPEIIARRGYDLNLISLYISDKKISPLNWYKVAGEILNNSQEFSGIDASLDIDLIIKAESIKPLTSEKKFIPKILAFDIEVDNVEIGKGEILMISLVSDNLKKVLTWKTCSSYPNYVETHNSEADMLEAFIKYIKQQDPDILTGYFSDGFDLPYLRARAEKNQIKLSLGLDNKQPTFARGKIPSAKISGIIHIDLFRFIQTAYSQYLQSETLSLNEVASELLGERKTSFEIKHSSKIKEHEWKDYFKYNLQDSNLTYKLANKIYPDLAEFSKIIQEPLYQINRLGMSQLVESYILHNLSKFNEIPEKRPIYDEISSRRARGKYEGAFVLQPKPGLYDNIAFFDFTSMYASVIVSFNLSLSTLTTNKKNSNLAILELGKKKEKIYFSKKPGFFTLMLKEIVEKRKKYKTEYKKNPSPITKARSNAYKLLANASYGYQGFFGARYYCIEAAAATAYFARKFIKKVIDKTNKSGFSVIYADTDGFAFSLNKNTKKQTLKFLEKLNSELPGIMHLELEDFYKRGIWVTTRSGKFGAKKKYALITESNNLKIRGFETVRRDWCNLAREVQNNILKFILEDGNSKKAVEYLKKIINQLKKRQIDKKQLLIRTQLKKPISEYKSISPHVIAAKKIQEAGFPIDIGMLVEYFIAETHGKKKLVREKVKLPQEKGEYNISYYLNNQIIPAVENILEVFQVNIQEIISGKKQTTLSGF